MPQSHSNLHKSPESWKRLRDRLANRAFANRTDSRKRSGAVSRSFQQSRLAAIVAKAEADS